MTDRHRQSAFPRRIKDQDAKHWIKQTASRLERSQNWVINNAIKEAMRHDRQPAAHK